MQEMKVFSFYHVAWTAPATEMSEFGAHRANIRSDRVLASILSHQPALVELDLGGNAIGDSGFADIVSSLQNCQCLENLGLTRNGLTCNASTMRSLGLVVTSLPKLNALHLSGNLIQDEGFQHLAPSLGQCNQLRALHLDECGLTGGGDSMALLSSVLLCLPHFECLSMCKNKIGDDGFDQLFIGLEECSQLTSLFLVCIGITSSRSMSTVVRLLQRLGHLKTLALTLNHCGGSQSDTELCQAVEGHPSLEELWGPRGMNVDAIRWLERIKGDPACVLKKVSLQ